MSTELIPILALAVMFIAATVLRTHAGAEPDASVEAGSPELVNA